MYVKSQFQCGYKFYMILMWFIVCQSPILRIVYYPSLQEHMRLFCDVLALIYLGGDVGSNLMLNDVIKLLDHGCEVIIYM